MSPKNSDLYANDGMDFFTNRPVSMNEKNNLLQIEEHMYILNDIEKPNVFSIRERYC